MSLNDTCASLNDLLTIPRWYPAGRRRGAQLQPVVVIRHSDLAAVSVVNGVGENKFDPDAQLTREQAAAMLSRLADTIGKPLEKKTATFADNTAISSWAFESVGQLQATAIMGGIGNNAFAPKDPYTREQSIMTIMRLFDIVC